MKVAKGLRVVAPGLRQKTLGATPKNLLFAGVYAKGLRVVAGFIEKKSNCCNGGTKTIQRVNALNNSDFGATTRHPLGCFACKQKVFIPFVPATPAATPYSEGIYMPRASKAAVLKELGADMRAGRNKQTEERITEPGGLPPDQERKDEVLATALSYLASKGVHYIPLASELAVDEAYDLPLSEFRRLVRKWLEDVTNAEKKRRIA